MKKRLRIHPKDLSSSVTFNLKLSKWEGEIVNEFSLRGIRKIFVYSCLVRELALTNSYSKALKI